MGTTSKDFSPQALPISKAIYVFQERIFPWVLEIDMAMGNLARITCRIELQQRSQARYKRGRDNLNTGLEVKID